MYTTDTLKDLFNREPALYRCIRKELADGLARTERIYSETCTESPRVTVRAMRRELGLKLSAAVVATLVNTCSHDGRISRTVAEWAQTVDMSCDREAALHLYIFSDRIHRAHLDQLARALMQEMAEAETETPKETPTQSEDAPRLTLYRLTGLHYAPERAIWTWYKPHPLPGVTVTPFEFVAPSKVWGVNGHEGVYIEDVPVFFCQSLDTALDGMPCLYYSDHDGAPREYKFDPVNE